jgi:hypothetical protein
VGRRVFLVQWVPYQLRQIHNTRNSERSLGLCLKLVTMQLAKPRPFCPCGWPPLLISHLRLFTAAERANPSVPAKSIQEMECYFTERNDSKQIGNGLVPARCS